MSTTTLNPSCALAQADLLLLVARCLSRPTAESRPDLDEERRDLEELASAAGLPEPAVLLAAVREMRAAEPAARVREHTRMFEGVLACLPNETAYVRRDKGGILADIAGFYNAFGFELAPQAGEKADHVITMLEFAALLLVMLDQARRHGDEAAEATTASALSAFVRDHLAEWLPLFCERLAGATTLSCYRKIAELLLSVWHTTLGGSVLPQPDPLRVVPADHGTPYECGMDRG